MNGFKKGLAAALLTTGALAGGCIGPNNTFRSVLHWNKGIADSKWSQEAVFLAFWVIPVYPLCLAADLIAFNAFDFWGWENPIEPPPGPV